MATIADGLSYAPDLQAISDSPRLDCELLLSHILSQDRAFLYAWPEHCLTDAQWEQFLSLFLRRKAGEPLAYIVGEKEFWSLPLLVTTAALIPRPETEGLVELALELLGRGGPDRRVLDLGTGTGAIALAIAKERPSWSVIGVEKFPAAVELARTNRRRLGIANASFQQSDWFDAVVGRFDLIVANPPYIDSGDKHLSQGDLRFEPRTALVAEGGGLADLRAIIRQAPGYLYPRSWLLLEHGYQQGNPVRQALATHGFSHRETRKDLAGLDRLSVGRYGS